MEANNEVPIMNIEGVLEELKCPICLDYFNDPMMELVNQHVFCRNCILKCDKFCPICRAEINELKECLFIRKILANIHNKKCGLKFETLSCDWKGSLLDYSNHKKSCEVLNKINSKCLLEILESVKQIKIILNKEINSHLKSFHLSIFNEYVQDWVWLENTNKDWKWWWWSTNPWWDEPCDECNFLFEKYEDEIEMHDSIRRTLIIF